MAIPDFSLETIFEDDHLLAIVKPAGLPTANAARGIPSVFSVLQSRRPAGAFLGVVSRLDAPVSGVVVMAKTRDSAAELARQFRERSVGKTYHAIVEGRFPAALEAWVDWHDRIDRRGEERRSRLVGGRGRASEPDGCDDEYDTPGDGPAGADCHVRARVLKRLGEVSLAELRPSTGRRHQLRAQLAGRGCPIVGDRTYGARLPFQSMPGFGPAIALHARSLSVFHPKTRQPLMLEGLWPAGWKSRFPALADRESPPHGHGGVAAV